MLTGQVTAAYLERIGVAGPVAADATGLRALHQAHLLAVPFENLSIHLAEPIRLNTDDLIGKIVTRRRGGFCYELNGAFALLLESLGARVQRVAAKVYGNGELGPPLDHLALIVHGSDGSGPWLCDVGFGAHSSFPLRLDERADQADPGGTFRLADTAVGDLEVFKDGVLQYLIELRDRPLTDFVPTCWWHQTSPESHFTASTVCSLLTPQGRISISGRTLIRTIGGSRTEERLPSDSAVLAAYREHFGISLARIPEVSRPQ